MKTLLKWVLCSVFGKTFVYFRIPGKYKRVVLTFDDGPHRINTPNLLAILKEENVKASFFLLGSEIEKYPELIESILQNGHDIGNHSFSHKTTKEIGFSNYCSDIVKTAGLIQKYSHFETKMFRSPYGELTLKLLSFIVLNKWNYISWTIDSRDSFIKDRADLVKYFETIPVCNGDIYLFHDDCAHTVEALPTIIRHLKNKGYTFTTLSEALKLR